MDGLSSQTFMRDLERAYNHQHLREPLQYLDFTLREREEYLDGAWNQDMAYWKNVLKDIPPPLPFTKHLPHERFLGVLQDTRKKILAALAHSRLLFGALIDELHMSRSEYHNLLFQTFVDYREGAKESSSFGGALIDVMDFETGKTAYDIYIDIADYTTGYKLNIMLMDSYHMILDTFSRRPTDLLFSPAIFPNESIGNALQLGLVHKEDPALKDGYESSLSYEQMFHRVQQIVAKLFTLGEKRGFKIAVFQERSVDWVCSLLAIMYVGAVYVPLDSIMPIERLSSIAGDCNPAAILFDNTTAYKLPGLDIKDTTTINVETLYDSAIGVHEIQATANNPAAILYTSGSTGTPNGIQIKHSSLRSSLHGDPISLTRLMASEQITMTAGTPSEYLNWINNGLQDLQRSPWKVAICGGEPITDSLIRAFRLVGKESLHLFNAYGPTEVTCSSHRAEITYSENLLTPIPVGKAAPNAHVYIVDSHLHPLPIGFTGEIVIGGAGIALGYLNNHSETRLLFLPNLFANPTAWAFMYRTGDMGHLLCDGSLMVGGRIAGDT
ncbi:hypothetical protein HYALB_00010098 [Hymenoscyphus albidus]|uniref:AMP-dependent synthetase/ligase domain-containing protein n=1 Tax=Hymenoscyphus albidus TaxID=595503 RepID=A0A9N9LJZ5_9HELO|nr:hypothetical protein HYALB_00010098 [Hymenoscyphus albidus]